MSVDRRRRSGDPPYWPIGTRIVWRYGDGPLAAGAAITHDGDTGVPHFAEPVTVVHDDADSLIAWLAAGTPVLQAARADGLGKREDTSTLFTADTVQAIGVWTDYDVLRIAPTGRPWSVCLFFAEHTGAFAGWYVNLEEPHLRDGFEVHTRDHVLDLVIAPDRSMTRKDEDELGYAVAQGLFDDTEAAAIEADAAEVEAIVGGWGPPFCDGWEQFRPDPAWPIPQLPSRTTSSPALTSGSSAETRRHARASSA